MGISYEHTIKRENGDKIIIKVSYADWKNAFRITWVGIIPKGKRNIRYVECTDNYDYRVLDTKGRNEYTVREYLKIATFEELKEAINKAWEITKPNIESVSDLFDIV